MAFSTNGIVNAWRFEDLDARVFAAMCGTPVADAKKRLASLKKQHADAAWIDETLGRLSIPSIAVLSLLAGHRGVMREDELFTLARNRFALTLEQLVPAIEMLLRQALIVHLRAGEHATEFAMVEPSAELLVTRVRDLDVIAPSGDFVPAEGLDGRALLAACAALAHVELKATQDGFPHRGGVKRIAKAIGLDDATFERLVITGRQVGVVVPRGESKVFRPLKKRLVALAHARYSLRILRAFCDRLDVAPRPATFDQVRAWMFDVASLTYQVLPEPKSLALVPGIQHGKIGNVDVLRRVALEGTAAASITPSFEVFLPPESRYEHIVEVLACAEVVRIDRVIVGRITKASIQRAIASGETGETIVAALSRASSRPLPQNVEAAITDWAAGCMQAILGFGRVIVVPPADEARVIAALEARGPRRLGPGVILLDHDAPRQVSAALGKLGYQERHVGRAYDGDDADADDHTDNTDFDDFDDFDDCDHAEENDERREADNRLAAVVGVRRSPNRKRTQGELPKLSFGDPALQQRVLAFRAGDPKELALATPTMTSPTPTHSTSSNNGNGATRRKPIDSVDDVENTITCSPEMIALVEAWEDDHGSLSDELAVSVATVLEVLPAVDRSFVLAAKTSKQLDKRVSDVLLNRGGFAALLAKHESLLEQVIPPEALALLRSGAPTSALPRDLQQLAEIVRNQTNNQSKNHNPQIRSLASDVIWYQDVGDLLVRLSAAARTASTYTLDLGAGYQPTVRIMQILPRGKTVMVLGENIEDDSPIAVPLSKILRIGERVETSVASETAKGRWTPLPGQPAPAGHLPCPCGSGKKYRACCRDAN